MWDGKKSLAESIFYDAMRQLGDKTGEEPLKVFKRAIDNVKPTVEVKSRRVGGSTYQVPIEVHQERRGALAGLPGVAQAKIWEPEPEVVYAWTR